MHKINCLVCGEELLYQKFHEVTCEICKQEFEAEVACKNGHYICDDCHAKDTRQIIEQHCLESTSTDPVQIAEELMALPTVKMHGPEHHFIVPAALLTAYYNHRGRTEEKAEKISLANKRSSHVLGGFCGFYGTCGAAMGTGIFMSLITDANPLSDHSWKESNRMTAKSLMRISDYNGPRCCKRDSFLSIEQAVDYLKEEVGCILPAKRPYCIYNETNEQCLGSACKYNEEQVYVCNIRVPEVSSDKKQS